VLLDETKQCRVVTVHGWGGAGKPTACKMLANDGSVRKRFTDGIIWVDLGENTSPRALTERFAHAVKRSGRKKTAESIIRHMNADRFELAKEEFQNWFDNRKVLFVLDNIWESKDRLSIDGLLSFVKFRVPKAPCCAQAELRSAKRM
jgi:predicted ATPase